LPRCPHCGLNYYPESGYYLGGMIMTYIATTFTLLAIYIPSLFLPESKTFSQNEGFAFWMIVAVLLAFAFVRNCYSLWLTINFWIDPWRPETPRIESSTQ